MEPEIVAREESSGLPSLRRKLDMAWEGKRAQNLPRGSRKIFLSFYLPPQFSPLPTFIRPVRESEPAVP